MSIATKQGDAGQTSLVGGARVSKADLRVEAYGTVDELNACLGFARSLCTDEVIASRTLAIQKTLFRVGGALASPADAADQRTLVGNEDVETLTAWIYEIESVQGILADWSIPGAHTGSAAYEMARTVCRRAERETIRFVESGGSVQTEIIAYLNRLSDLLWLFGRLIEHQAGLDAKLRDDSTAGPRWSRAWK